MAQFPSREVARAELRVPHARPGLRQPRHAADGAGHPVRQRQRAAPSAARSPPCCTGDAYATSAEMAKELGPFPGYERNKQHMLRVIRNHRRAAYNAARDEYEGLTIQPDGHQRRVLPERSADGRPRRCGPHAGPGRAARLPQRAGHRDRADRHDRPGDGLRHDRHRARLRAGEVQEARRRRLLQDRQPVACRRRCASSATPRRRSKTSSSMPSASAR